MYNQEENLLNNFDVTALASVNSIYTEFLFSIKDVDRQKNENTFQLWLQKYVDKLKQSLEGKALEYISINRHLPTLDWFHKKLTYMISQYLQEFLQRTNTFNRHTLHTS
ncbi:hypothetical protein [Chitinophaga ginsengisoli]|uniref:Uncharacterized protein n=1 Tax=Chitinophaga ginsengisoli TaxID=363837 RepID=A0A2P8GAM6_9BACT|nr:hypothetical protein [Chitinophaga ginsengisoli]PSL30998.1 hypothetical protein CLV42_105361 [Chitinophaga ginsengisoli]